MALSFFNLSSASPSLFYQSLIKSLLFLVLNKGDAAEVPVHRGCPITAQLLRFGVKWSPRAVTAKRQKEMPSFGR